MVTTRRIQIQTKGDCDIIDITAHIARELSQCDLGTGTVTVFVAHSTCGISTVEYEPGLVEDLTAMFDRIAPRGIPYGHDRRWGDGNGHAHVRASLIGSSLVIPFTNSQLTLGTWQQVILLDFDNRPRNREIILQIIGE